jgi:hypothetical protein
MATRPRYTRQQRGQAKRVANRMLTVERREFPSASNPAKSYTAVVHVGGKVMCDCMPRECKHTRAVVAGRATRTDGEFIYINQGVLA